MASTYVNDLRLNEMATGDGSGTWGTTTNTNLELIAEAFSFGTEGITTNADTHTSTIADGATDPVRSMYVKYTGTLDSACTITIAPNTVCRMQFIENATSGSQNIIISQGSGANVTIPAGDVKAVYLDGAGSGAAVVDAFASLSVVDLKVQDDLTVTDDLIVNGDIDLEGAIDVQGATNLDNVDIDGAVDMASTLQVDGAITSSAGMTITVADNSDVLTIISTDADASSGPNITLYRNSGSPADSDNLGDIHFKGRNDNSQDVEYAVIDGRIVDASDGTEDGKLEIVTIVAGSGASRINMINTETVLNDDSIDLDFRVESNGNANMLFVDGGNDRVGIGVVPTHHFNLQGTGTVEARFRSSDGDMSLQISSDADETHDSDLTFMSGTSGRGSIVYDHNTTAASQSMIFKAGDNVERARITSDGISVTGTVTQSTAKTAQFTGQYDGRETTTITLGSLGFKPQVLFCIFNVGTAQNASWGMAARDGGHQALLDYDVQAAADGYESVTAYFGRLAFGSAIFSNLAVSSWDDNQVVIQKSVDNSGSSSTCKYKITVMG
jgi:hypothetical protein